MLRRLGWHPGTRVDLREDYGLIAVLADPHAAFQVSGQGFLLLRATLRRWCHVAEGVACCWSPTHLPAGW